MKVVVTIWCRLFSSFFFSSRRRNTRVQGDWSSDVCSSDLPPADLVPGDALEAAAQRDDPSVLIDRVKNVANVLDELAITARSEERRVGKEWRGEGAEGR